MHADLQSAMHFEVSIFRLGEVVVPQLVAAEGAVAQPVANQCVV